MDTVWVLEWFTGQSNRACYSNMDRVKEALDVISMTHDVDITLEKMNHGWYRGTAVNQGTKSAAVENISVTLMTINPGNPFNVIPNIVVV